MPGGARVSDFFSQRIQICKKKKKKKKRKINVFFFFFFFFFWGGGGGGGGVDGWTVEQAQINLSLQLLQRWGHNSALMYQLCP